MTKKELTDKCREILYKGVPIVGEEDTEFLLNNVFILHPNWPKKRGVGIKRIEVRDNPKYNNKNFFIIRLDDTETDISFTKCISNPTDFRIIKNACRNAIEDIIIDFRDSIILPFICPITGEEIDDYRNIHVDHYDLEFDDLVMSWIRNNNLSIQELKDNISNGIDNEIGNYFLSQSICDDFRNYHNNNTHLRLVSKRANLSNLRRK